MKKPDSLSVKNFLIRKVSTELVISEVIVEAIVSHQLNGLTQAVKVTDAVELSGFGKFFLGRKSLARKRGYLENTLKISKASLLENITPRMRENIMKKIYGVGKMLEELKMYDI